MSDAFAVMLAVLLAIFVALLVVVAVLLALVGLSFVTAVVLLPAMWGEAAAMETDTSAAAPGDCAPPATSRVAPIASVSAAELA